MIRRYSRHWFLFLISLGKSLILEGVKFFPLAAFSSLSSRATTQVGFRSETDNKDSCSPFRVCSTEALFRSSTKHDGHFVIALCSPVTVGVG